MPGCAIDKERHLGRRLGQLAFAMSQVNGVMLLVYQMGPGRAGIGPSRPMECPPVEASERRPFVGAYAYCGSVDIREAAKRWADVWERGWREHDAAAIAALYAEGAVWRQHPFRAPDPGYLDRVFAEEESAQCQFGPPIVDGDRAAVPWTAQTKLKDGRSEDLAGASLLRFTADGLVVEEHDYWNER